MEAGSEDMQTNDMGVEKLMDEYLKSNGFYRKKIAKDGSCLFRAVAEQVLRCQSRHTEVRATCVDYLKNNRTKYELFIEGNFEEYLQRLEDPQNWVGEVEISALALIYRHDFIIFQEPGKPPVNITENSFSDKVRLCFLNGNHYDSVYPTEFVNNAAICQSILYELLYEKVYGVDHSVVAPSLKSSGDDVYGECKSSEESDLEEEEDFWSNDAVISSNMNNRRSSNSNQSSKTTKSHHSGFSLSQRVQMSLNPSFFRNVEYDVWLKSKRAQQKRDFCIAAGMQYTVGDKCKVRLDNTGRFYSAYIQAVDLDNGPITVFIEELGKKHSIPLWNLRPTTVEGESWSTVAERGKKLSLVNGNGHHSERNGRGGRKPGRGPPTSHSPVAGVPGGIQKQHSWPPQASVEEQAAGRNAYPTARSPDWRNGCMQTRPLSDFTSKNHKPNSIKGPFRKSELGSPSAPVQEPHFGLSPNERLAREEEQKSQALLEIMHRDERSFPALGSLAGSRAAPQATDGGKKMTAQAGERRPYRRKGDPQELSQDIDNFPRSGQRGEKNKLLNKCVSDPEQRSPSAEPKLTVQRRNSSKEASAQPGCSPRPQSAEPSPLPEPSTPAVSTPPPAISSPASTATAPPPAATAPPRAAAAPPPAATAAPPPLYAPVTTQSTPAARSPPAPTPSAFAQSVPAPVFAPALAPPPHIPSLARPVPSPVSAAPIIPCPAVLTAPPPMAPNPPQQRDPASPTGFPSASFLAEPSPYNGANPCPPGMISHLGIAPGPPTPPVLLEHLPHPHAPSPSLPPHASLPPFHQFPQLYQDPLYPGFPVNDKDELATSPQYSFMRNGQDLPREIGVLRFFFNLGVKAYTHPMWLPHTYLYQLQQAHMNYAMQTKIPFVTSWYPDAPPPGPVLRISSMPPGAMVMREGYGHTTGYAQAMAGGRVPGQYEHTHCPVQPGLGVGMVGAALAPQHADLGLGPDGKPVLGYSPQLASPLPPNLGDVTWTGPHPNTYPGTFSAPRPPPPAQYLPPSSPQYPPISLGYHAPRLSCGAPVMATVPQVSGADGPHGKCASPTPTEGSPADVPSPAPAPERERNRPVASPPTGPSPPSGIPTEQAPPTEDRRTTGSGVGKSKSGRTHTAASTVAPQGLPMDLQGLPMAPMPQMVKICVKEDVRSVVISQGPDCETGTGTMAGGGVPIEGPTQSVTPSSEPQPYNTAYSPREVWEEDGEPSEATLESGRSYYSRSYKVRRGYEEGRGYRENRWRGEGRGEGRGYRGQRRPEDRRDYNYRDRKGGENYPNHPSANYKGPNSRGRGRGYNQYPSGRETGYPGVNHRSNAYPES